MKRLSIILGVFVFVISSFVMQSCKEDEPVPQEKQAFTYPTIVSPVVKDDGTVGIKALSPTDSITLEWASENSEGDAVSWDVYFGTGKQPALYKSGLTVNKINVPVLDGETYYWKVKIADSRGIITTSPIWSFIPIDSTSQKMKVSMTCTTDVNNVIGVDMAADEIVDLRMFIISKSTMSDVAVIDNGFSSESFAFATLADGEYIVAVDLLSSINFGSIDKPIDLSLNLNFFQLGIINQDIDFSKVIDNKHDCATYRTFLVTVKKEGAVYTINKDLQYWVDPAVIDYPTALVGSWKGWDADPSYVSQVSSVVTSGELLFTGIGRDWMYNDWGEVIINEYPISMNFNFCDGTVTIPQQTIMNTTYLGKPQPEYAIEGIGTIDISGTYPKMTIHYDFVQAGTGIAHYFGLPYFTLELTLDPAGLKLLKSDEVHLVKPIR